ncbi:MAG: nucleotide pyrophosphohydrolase [Nanobdellota archaeon]
MDMKTMQGEIDAWITTKTPGYWAPLSMMARLTEETGELARLLNHVYGEKKKKKDEVHESIEGEMGDLLFTIICMSNALGVDLNEAYEKTLEKCRIRDKDRFRE